MGGAAAVPPQSRRPVRTGAREAIGRAVGADGRTRLHDGHDRFRSACPCARSRCSGCGSPVGAPGPWKSGARRRSRKTGRRRCTRTRRPFPTGTPQGRNCRRGLSPRTDRTWQLHGVVDGMAELAGPCPPHGRRGPERLTADTLDRTHIPSAVWVMPDASSSSVWAALSVVETRVSPLGRAQAARTWLVASQEQPEIARATSQAPAARIKPGSTVRSSNACLQNSESTIQKPMADSHHAIP